MIVFDTPRAVRFRRFRRTAHCASTLVGEDGTAELLAFGGQIGLRSAWLQCPGTAKEHFDLFDRRIEVARAAGAIELSPKAFVEQVVMRKRQSASLTPL